MRSPAAGVARRRIAFWAIAAVALLVAHDLVYLVQLGPGCGLADARPRWSLPSSDRIRAC